MELWQLGDMVVMVKWATEHIVIEHWLCQSAQTLLLQIKPSWLSPLATITTWRFAPMELLLHGVRGITGNLETILQPTSRCRLGLIPRVFFLTKLLWRFLLAVHIV